MQVRAAELGIDIVRQGFADKLTVTRQLIDDLGVVPEEVCFIGDDLSDLPALRFVGLGACVADASPEVRDAAQLVTQLSGGHGAVREAIEQILKAQQRWDELVQKYLE